MLQVFHLDVAKVDMHVAYICKCFICFHTYVANVSSRCLQCLHTCFQVFLVSLICKCFSCFRRMLQVLQLFQTYVASASSGCCKSRSNIAHVAMGLTCRSRLLQLLGHHHGSPCGRLRSADASAVWHPQAGVGEWDPHGFLRAGAVVRRNSSMGSMQWGAQTQTAWASFTCSAASRARDRRRPIFWAAPDVRALVTPYY
jgi:hypothetical protein